MNKNIIKWDGLTPENLEEANEAIKKLELYHTTKYAKESVQDWLIRTSKSA